MEGSLTTLPRALPWSSYIESLRCVAQLHGDHGRHLPVTGNAIHWHTGGMIPHGASSDRQNEFSLATHLLVCRRSP